jgi:hypothetical protein
MTDLNVGGAAVGAIIGFMAWWWVASLAWKGRASAILSTLLLLGLAAGVAVLSVHLIHVPRVLKEGLAAPDIFDIFTVAASLGFVAAAPVAMILSGCLRLLQRPGG